MARSRRPPGVRRWLRSRRFEIVDRSMEPTLRPGDRVLVDPRSPDGGGPRTGAVVAAVDPTEPARWLVKRVAGVGPGEVKLPIEGLLPGEGETTIPLPSGTVYLLSDATAVGRDSRQFGPIPVSQLRGEVWYVYAPAARRGPVTPFRATP